MSKLPFKKLKKDVGTSAFFLGLTGSGKSSLISYILGANIAYVKQMVIWKLTHNDPNCPKIGNTNESCTVLPSIYEFNDMALYDPPGFLDTKGVYQEILNSYANAKMFRRGVKTKIIMVVQFGSVTTARGGPLVDIAKRLRELFQNDFKQVINSCGLIVSKVNMAQEESVDNIYSFIRSLYLQNNNLGPECQALLRTIVQCKRIIFFPQPKYIKPDILNGIKLFVKNVPTFVMANEPVISLSFEAKISVQQVANQTQKEMTQLSHTIGKAVQNNFRKQYNKQELNQALIRIKSSVEMITRGELQSGLPNKITEFAQKLSITKQLGDNLSELMKRLNFCITLHPSVVIFKNISETLMTYLIHTEKQLEYILQKIVSKEEKQQLQLNHQMILQEQSKIFSAQVSEMQKKGKQRQDEIRKSISNDQTAFMKMMQESNQQHLEKINQLTQQIANLARPPPPPPRRGWCQIMLFLIKNILSFYRSIKSWEGSLG